jgi:hypothetical protein
MGSAQPFTAPPERVTRADLTLALDVALRITRADLTRALDVALHGEQTITFPVTEAKWNGLLAEVAELANRVDH